MDLIDIAKEIPREKIERILSKGEIKYLQKSPFRTESCGECSHLLWGYHTIKGFKVDWEHGETAGCDYPGEPIELDNDPGADKLTPEDALSWYRKRDSEGDYIRGNILCKGYDGQIPHTIKEIQSWITEKARITKKIQDNL